MAFKLEDFEPGHHASALGILYRDMTEQDSAFTKAVFRSSREAELERTGWEEWQRAEFIDMQYRAQHSHYQIHYPNARWLIIEHKNEQIGRLYIEEWDEELRVIDIALLEQARGQGLGGAILRDILELAQIKKKEVGIHVEKENPAMNLYRRLGFEKTSDKGVYDLLHWKPDL